ncbi:ABC transporter permease [Verminephrobacter aporrectodeae subsp. tuberculatae]|uniref:ABC transporter permease n=1 Tax=Verminephrobacter aporrectodeae subsp. tuberculatae TaxID=1110392 RepID=A0ABT3KYJ8_9BURK|nr:ABC transporter permease [Verminephrobacter aporrectodeae]MCW5323416.1 ABC transporter permease [Verminephrobacter aporrectodeae subsp. tuberculatae]
MSAIALPESTVPTTAGWRQRLRYLLRAYPPLVLLCALWMLATVAIALLAGHLAPYAHNQIDLQARLAPPYFMGGSAQHWLGTDELGRDILSRLMLSIRISLLVALVSTLLSATLGVFLGFLAAHFRGWVEQLVLTLVDFQAAMPFMIIALAVLAFFGNTLTLFIALMGLYGWERSTRITRGLCIAANEQGYAAAAFDIGASPLRVYLLHVLPNIASTLIVGVTLTFPEVILLESGLSFLGLGVQPPMTSLGNMVGYGREYLQTAPWMLLTPSAVIVLTSFSVGMLGDWLRDRLDPSLR